MFRVLQFNMQFGMGWDAKAPDNGPVDVKATIGEIRRHKPDIVLLQEVEHAQFGGVQVQPAPNYTQIKAALPEFDSWFSYPKADPRELPFGIGLAIFSRTPLLEKLRIGVPSPAIEFVFRGRKTTPTDRVMIGAKTTVGGREIQVYNVHLLAFFMLGMPRNRRPHSYFAASVSTIDLGLGAILFTEVGQTIALRGLSSLRKGRLVDRRQKNDRRSEEH